MRQDESLGNDGALSVRIAKTAEEVVAAQQLRYRIFYQEMGARPSEAVIRHGRDIDRFDGWCDHLLVIDPAGGRDLVVGTYRMLRGSVARQHGGFYSDDEYDLAPVRNYPREVLEVGRSCVDAAYRSRAVLQLLWQGIMDYVWRHRIGLLFGCASLPGTEPEQMKRALSFLHHNFLAKDYLRPRAVAARHVSLDMLPVDAIDAAAAWRELPPLLRGYLRAGGRIGDGGVIDYDFNTTDVCLVLETEQVTQKYLRHYRQADDEPRDRPAL
jgi:putative hemolysin